MIVEKVREFFLKRNMVELDEDEIRHLKFKPTLAFADGKNRVFVNILPVNAVRNRNAFIRFMMESSALREQCNLMYIVIPSLWATIIDSEILRDMGIGLIVLSGDELKVVLPSREYEPKITLNARLAEEIIEISSRVKRLEESLSKLEIQVERIIERIGEIKFAKQAIREPVKAKVKLTGLPSYMQDNPWLEILRGRGEREIAK